MSLLLEDMVYFSYLMSSAYRMWDEFYPKINLLPPLIQWEIYLFTPYDYVPENYFEYQTFLSQWIKNNQDKRIILNGDEVYMTETRYQGGKIYELEVYHTVNEQESGYGKTIYFSDNGDIIDERDYFNGKDVDLGRQRDRYNGFVEYRYGGGGQVRETGYYWDGYRTGVWRKWYAGDGTSDDNGLPWEIGEYVNGKRKGLWRKWDRHGNMSEGNYVGNKKEGQWVTHSKSINGITVTTTDYVHGKKIKVEHKTIYN